ncbi:hypothetical protein BASA81_009849 [Batrachochytrium salamandrivorans]|nr:hypothetical protein BASA81_009849 [Batrachochytrium salamandrivorans]
MRVVLLVVFGLWWLASAAKLSGNGKRFNIDLQFRGQRIPKQLKSAFPSAAKRWTSVITKDYATSFCFFRGTTSCGVKFTQTMCVDDLLIFIQVKKIDGLGGVLAQAGPCFWDELGKARLGIMYFDVADANSLWKTKRWESVVLHEMGHVLGLGSLAWDLFDLRTSNDPYLYLGAQGNLGNRAVGGPEPQAILEDVGESSTVGSHWKESVYGNELMTGYVAKPRVKMPLSLLTVKALQDLGYEVDETKADPYQVKPVNAKRTKNSHDKLSLGNDMLKFTPNNRRRLALEGESIIKTGREQDYADQKSFM